MITIINVNLEKKNDFYSKFSKQKISNELAEYILNECYGEPYKNSIKININCKTKISDNEKHEMIDIIRRTFGLRVQDELYYAEKSQNKKTILLLIGLALIIIYYCSIVSVLREIILILGWLAIWESIYGLLFDMPKDFIKIKRLKELAKARVYFEDSSQAQSKS